jgi:predicted DNA-binding transcriptional regulator YafY
MAEKRVDPLERQSELLLLLVESGQALTRAEIVGRVHDYPPDPESARRQFERDKDVLVAQGVPMLTHERFEEWRYEIRAEQFYLGGLDLTWDEQVALDLALAVVRVGDAGPEAGLLHKLGAELDPTLEVLVAVPHESGLAELHDALRRDAAVRFRYRSVDRDVDLWAMCFLNAHWYTVGWDRGRGAQRVFRVDRIEGPVEVVRPGTVTVPDDFDPESVVTDQLQLPGDEPAVAEVWIDSLHAAAVTAGLGDKAASVAQDDGSAVVTFPISHRGAFRSWLFGLLDHAKVLGPPELRDDVVGWLRAMVPPP